MNTPAKVETTGYNFPANAEVRDKIEALETKLRALISDGTIPEEKGSIQHHFIPGVYARELARPVGTVVVGKLHKFPRLLILSKGDVTFTTETEHRRVQAPYTVVLPPGSKIATLSHTDSVLTSIHRTDELDLEAIEAELIASSYEEYDTFCEEQKTKLNKSEEI